MMRVVFDQPQRALTPGQAAIFYAPADSPDPDLLLGGGLVDLNWHGSRRGGRFGLTTSGVRRHSKQEV